MNAQELFVKSLANYDHSYSTNDTFYYNLPYKKDFDLCNWKPMRMYSGNIIKFYQYHLDKPVVLFTDTEEISDPHSDVSTDEPTETHAGPEEFTDMGEALTSDESSDVEAESTEVSEDPLFDSATPLDDLSETFE